MALHEFAPQDEQQYADAARIDLSTPADDTIVVVLTGEHDLSTRELLLEALALAGAQAQPNLIVDLTPCTFVDSSIIGVLAKASETDPAAQRVAIIVPNQGGIVDRAFALLSLREIMRVYETVDDALNDLLGGAHEDRAAGDP